MSDRRERNGWRDGRDPAQRWLRIGATIVFIGVAANISLDPSRTDDVPRLALILAAALILMGYETIIKIPGIWRNRSDD